MKTIEERARQWASAERPCGGQTELIRGYIAGATDQKQIDEDAMHAIMEGNVIKAIEKQRQIDNEHLERIVSQWKREETLWIERHNEIQKQMIDKAWEFMCTHYVVGMEYDDFVKAMEK